MKIRKRICVCFEEPVTLIEQIRRLIGNDVPQAKCLLPEQLITIDTTDVNYPCLEVDPWMILHRYEEKRVWIESQQIPVLVNVFGLCRNEKARAVKYWVLIRRQKNIYKRYIAIAPLLIQPQVCAQVCVVSKSIAACFLCLRYKLVVKYRRVASSTNTVVNATP